MAESAARAASRLATFSQEQIDALVEALREAALPRAESWARLAVEETGFGNVPDKIQKNLFATVDLHRHIAPMMLIDSMVYSGVFERHPALTLLLAELGVGWLPFLYREIDDRISPNGWRRRA